jgi:hypothetical protein
MVQQREPEMLAIADALAEPFEVREVKFKPQMVKANRCMAMAYIDARLVQDRLDEVLGVENWGDTYQLLPDGSVVCRLRCKLGGRWITKTDVGSPSEQPDQGDRLKAAFSDALKRAAVKFGIGRYLYRLSAQWVDYDPVKKQIVSPPQLPAFAIPKAKAPGAPQGKPAAAPADPYAAERKGLRACGSMQQLAEFWHGLDDHTDVQAALALDKEKRKSELQAARPK